MLIDDTTILTNPPPPPPPTHTHNKYDPLPDTIYVSPPSDLIKFIPPHKDPTINSLTYGITLINHNTRKVFLCEKQ